MSKRASGGGIYLRNNIYWIRYSHRGQEYRESAGSDSEAGARRLLRQRIQETGKRGAKYIGPAEERLRFEDLAGMLIADYSVNDRRSSRRIEGALKHLSDAFALSRAVDITTDRIQSYVADRRDQGATNATINRELSALRRSFRLALHSERLSRAPHIAMLDENNARQGFVEHADFLALRDGLPSHLKDPIGFLYYSGWRVSEALSLEWNNVDLAGQVVRLAPEKSKTKDGRVLPLSGELIDIIDRAHQARRLDCLFVFHRSGKQIGTDIRIPWRKACAAAGLGKLLVHDLRRSAIRHLIRSGVPERVAMAISGHKTRSIFDRYNIVSETDLRDGLKRRDAYLGERPTERKIVPLK